SLLVEDAVAVEVGPAFATSWVVPLPDLEWLACPCDAGRRLGAWRWAGFAAMPAMRWATATTAGETGFVTGAVGTARNGDGVPDATGDAVGDANGDAVPDATTCGELAAVAPSLVCRSGRALGSVVVPTCGARVCPVPAGRSPLE